MTRFVCEILPPELAKSKLGSRVSLLAFLSENHVPQIGEHSGASLCSPTTTWVCPTCGRWYQTIRKRDEMPLFAKRRCIEQHIEEGCRAYTEQSANAKDHATDGA